MRRQFYYYLLGSMLVLGAVSAHAQAGHMLLSEVGIAPSDQTTGRSSEYIEIFNPTAAPISLDNYYISDSNFYTSFTVTEDGKIDTGVFDNTLRFPAGSVLASGQVAVVTGGASNFLTAFYATTDSSVYRNLAGSPLLFEVGETDATVPNMIVLNRPQITDAETVNLNFTNASVTNGEFVVLFHWNGTNDLVQDVDIVAWGGQTSGGNAFSPKTPARIGRNGTAYFQDNGNMTNLTLGSGFSLITRTSINEPSETTVGGNGLTGHDESTELARSSWTSGTLATDKSPGLTGLVAVGANAPPVINSAERDLQYPSATQVVTLTANVTDPDGTVASVRFFVDSGTGFSPVVAASAGSGNYTAAIGPYANGTIVNYYVEAKDNRGDTAFLPALAPGDFKSFLVDSNPVVEGDVVINEILFDNPGVDTYEFVELYNTRNTPLSLANFRFADATRAYFQFPAGAEIPANGYVVLSLDPASMEIQYLSVAGVPYYDWGTFVLNQGGDELVLVHPNGFDFNGVTTFVDRVEYATTAPWPVTVPGETLELKNPALDNSMGQNWSKAVNSPAIGTPGQQNSSFSTAPVIGNIGRNSEFPAPSTPVVVEAIVTPIGASSVQAVRLYVNTGTGFTAVNMTPGAAANQYTATLPGYPEGTIVKYYVEAESNQGAISKEPINAPAEFRVFLVSAAPALNGDIVINEILYDNIGGDAYEYVELYNPRNSPIALPYFRFADATMVHFTFPEDAVIPANGFVVLSLNPGQLAINYTVSAGVPVYDWGEFVLNNGGDTVVLQHPNSIDYNGTTTNLDEVTFTNASPWPVTNSNVSGRSIELLSPELDNSQGSNWAGSVPMNPADTPGSGTPGAVNTSGTSNVPDWNLY